jgi:3-oxoacyl-[acyl-carrier protein] reductase
VDLGIKGRTALITGASQGIGKGLALAFAQEGANVAICARREGVLEEVAAEARGMPGSVFAKAADVTVPGQIAEMVEATRKTFGRVDILVNNAGAATKVGPFVELEEADWQGSIDLNLLSCVRFSRAVMPEMQTAKWGRIVNISSVAGLQVGAPPVNTLVEYGTNKAAVIALTKYMSEHVAEDNVLINCICPGPILTPGAWGSMSDEVVAQRLESVPMGRLGTVEEIADLVLFLSSDRCTYITGATIPIDGGACRTIA